MHPKWREALQATRDLAPTPKSIARIGAQYGEELARWAFLQQTLRERGRTKFAKADEMLFDRPGLEMASHETVAAYHASRFPNGEVVADLTAGIGADLIALAARGPAVGYELDPQRAAYARHNLAVHNLKAEVVVQNSLVAEWNFDYAFADPARRTESGKTWNPQEFSPHPVQLAERLRNLKMGGMKLSPMIRDDFFRHLPGRLEFISFAGECREALVWMGAEATEGRFAVRIDDPVPETLPEGEHAETSPAALDFLYEADPAAIRGHALGTLVQMQSIRLLADSNGYLTSETKVDSPWLTSYRVLADHSADLRRTAAVLRSLGAGTPVVKSRVARFDVEQLRRQLRGEGPELIVAVYSEGKRLRHSVLERL